MEMDFVAPDRYRMKMPMGTQYVIGDTMYMTMNGRTMKTPLPQGQVGEFRDPAKFAEHKATMTVEALGSEAVDGQAATQVSGPQHPARSRRVDDVGGRGRLSACKIEVTGDAGGQVTRTTIRYSRFNDPTIKVEPPADRAALQPLFATDCPTRLWQVPSECAGCAPRRCTMRGCACPLNPSSITSPSPGDEVKTTTCYMCACRCGIKVWLADGKIRYIQGNPEHPVNKGVLCAKGSAGIMQHYSPARLDKPLLRVGERGKGEFREIEWDEALEIATSWLAPIRERNPDELAFFTGRDQSQALTGWWAQQFGTVNYAAHGGFCSVNMAAGGLYTLGGSFWEFGEPDWEHTKYLMMWGVAEDHDSNPIKLGLGKLKGRGAKIVAVNPVRTGYGAIADEWIGIRPGTDGLFAFALIHELLNADRIDLDYLVRYTNAHWLVMHNPHGADDGLFARDADGKPLCWDRSARRAARRRCHRRRRPRWSAR